MKKEANITLESTVAGKAEETIRDAANYGGRIYRMPTFTGEPVERFAAPVKFNLNDQSFSFTFELWEDVSDFEAAKPAIDSQKREFAGSISDYSEFAEFFAAINSGALDFLNLSEKDFVMTSISIDALNFNIAMTARHQTRSGYFLRDSFSDLRQFQQVKERYLDSIVMPFLQMAWTLGATDRNLSKFE